MANSGKKGKNIEDIKRFLSLLDDDDHDHDDSVEPSPGMCITHDYDYMPSKLRFAHN